MNTQKNYKEQSKLSFIQFLSDIPDFIALLISAIISKSLIVVLDLIDEFGDMFRTGMVSLISRKLSKNLKYEYNYGIGKVEAIASLLCDGIIFLGLLLTFGLSIYELINPSKPSGFLIAVAGLKVINVCFDTAFFINQRKIMKNNNSSFNKSNYTAAKAALMLDSATLIILLVIWLLRDNVIGMYITPIVSIIIVIYLVIDCIKRVKHALDDITDKTLPEDVQMKILSVMAKYIDRYENFEAVKSRRNGEFYNVDFLLSFENETTFEEIVALKNDLQVDMDKILKKCTISIVIV